MLMVDANEQSSTHVLMSEMGLTSGDVARRLKTVGLRPEDYANIAAIKPLVQPEAEPLATAFFDYLAAVDPSRTIASNRSIAERARRLKTEHIFAMVSGEYEGNYVEQRLELALLYAKAGLELPLFLGAFHHLLEAIGRIVMKPQTQDPLKGFESFMSLEKVAFFDVGIMVDAMVFERERVIGLQQQAIRELSTPVLQIRERLLLLPIIGVIDTHRARLVTESLLRSIRTNRAKVVVMDVTGVATIDSKVANHLIQTVTAAKLMGASVIVTGLSADVAQSLVALGIDLTKLNTVGDLEGGMEEAEAMLGYRVAWADGRPPRAVLPSPKPIA